MAAIVDGFSRKLLALKVYKDAPATRNMIALVKVCVKTFGTPRFVVTDHGCQFRAWFKAAMELMEIEVVKGRRGRAAQFNGKCERFVKTFKIWQRATLFAWKLDWIQRRLNVYRQWYNEHRPMFILGGRTPDEIWNGIPLPDATPMRIHDPICPAINMDRKHYRGDPHLPIIDIHIVRSVELIA